MTEKPTTGTNARNQSNPDQAVPMSDVITVGVPKVIHTRLKELIQRSDIRKKYGNQYKPDNDLKLNELVTAFLMEGIEAAESKKKAS